MKKIIFFDVDDTLIYHRGDKSYIPDSTMRAIKELHNEGHIVAIASGRGYVHMGHIMDLLNIKHAVCFNGNMLVVDHKIIYKEPLNDKDIRRFVKDLKKKIFPAFAMDENIVYVKDFLGKVRRAFIKEVKVLDGDNKDMFIENMQKMRVNGITYYSMMLFNKRFKDMDKYPELSFKKWGEKGYEVGNKGVSKLSGIVKMAEYFNVDLDDIYAFGDNYNDIEMLSGIKNGIAMGNGVDEVKEVASYITDHIDDNGIENACIHFKLIDLNENKEYIG